MRGWFNNLKWKAQSFMLGRYGQDEFYLFLTITGFVFLLLSAISQVFWVLGLFCVLYALFRCYSRNITKRRKEREAYLRIAAKPKNWFSLQKRKWEERKTHRYFKCSNCKQVLRVPKGKGKIAITCPKCQTKNTHKT